MKTGMSLELELLSELRGALTEYEIRSEVNEEVCGLAVSTDTPGIKVWVFVSFSTRYFSWTRATHQHPVGDMTGAARRIATHVKGLRLLGEPSRNSAMEGNDDTE
jgi:hypothetical protein